MKKASKLKRLLRVFKSYACPDRIGYLIAFVTTRCNFKCPFCFAHTPENVTPLKDELSLDEFDLISQRLKSLVQLSIGGGEPFLRPDLSEITAIFIDNCSPSYITLPTNAWFSDRIEAYFSKLLPQYPWVNFRLVFSIDGVREEHDKLRGVSGAFERIETSYKVACRLRNSYKNIVLDSNSVYQSDTQNTIMSTLEYLHKYFTFDNMSVTYVRGNVLDPQKANVEFENYLKTWDFLYSIKRRKEGRFLYPVWRAINDVSRENLLRTVHRNEFVVPCVAGRKLVVLRENGDVYPCELLPRKMGNVRDNEYDLPRVLASDESVKLTSWIVDSKCKCSFECAQAANVIWNLSSYPKLCAMVIKNISRVRE